MNEYQKRLIQAPTIRGFNCVFCGRPRQAYHHIVPRSQGGGNGPVIPVCGCGNESGCHGLLHSHRLHLAYDPRFGLSFKYTPEPTRYEDALGMAGWMPLHSGRRRG